MRVASLELCKELYELSGWHGDTSFFPVKHSTDDPIPAYDLGYLLRKLPTNISANLILEADGNKFDKWCIYYDDAPVRFKSYYNASPEEAATKLAIELFKQGILTKGNE